MTTVHGEWIDTSQALIPAKVPSLDYDLARIAFYAGAMAMIRLMKRNADEAETEIDFNARVERMKREIYSSAELAHRNEQLTAQAKDIITREE